MKRLRSASRVGAQVMHKVRSIDNPKEPPPHAASGAQVGELLPSSN
jgi:hypothetical protein